MTYDAALELDGAAAGSGITALVGHAQSIVNMTIRSTKLFKYACTNDQLCTDIAQRELVPVLKLGSICGRLRGIVSYSLANGTGLTEWAGILDRLVVGQAYAHPYFWHSGVWFLSWAPRAFAEHVREVSAQWWCANPSV